jgi:hypothetical protein
MFLLQAFSRHFNNLAIGTLIRTMKKTYWSAIFAGMAAGIGTVLLLALIYMFFIQNIQL